MNNGNEKITINLGVVELAQIDVLVEQGIYSNRSDFIRSAIRKQLVEHKDDIQQILPIAKRKDDSTRWAIGIMSLSKETLEELAYFNEKIRLTVVGMLIVDSDVTPELFKAAVAKVTIRGKLLASDEIKELIN